MYEVNDRTKQGLGHQVTLQLLHRIDLINRSSHLVDVNSQSGDVLLVCHDVCQSDPSNHRELTHKLATVQGW